MLSDIVPLSAFVFEDVPVVQREMYIAKGADLEKTKKALSEGSSILLSGLKGGKEESAIEEELVELSKALELKVNGVFQPLRVAITNSTVSLPLFDSISLLGLEETEKRIRRAEKILEE